MFIQSACMRARIDNDKLEVMIDLTII